MTKTPPGMEESTIANTVAKGLKQFLKKREGGVAPIAPLTNREWVTPLQDIRDQTKKPPKSEAPTVIGPIEKKG